MKRERFVGSLIGAEYADEVYKQFLNRIGEGEFSQEENPQDHFCVYFAAYDPDRSKVFIGLHKKSGTWLFNGGHLDLGEDPAQALRREIKEEWGIEAKISDRTPASLITITKIDNPRVDCKQHFDLWYPFAVDSATFMPQTAELDREFHQIGWFDIKQARQLVIDPATQEALSLLFS